MKKQGVSEMWSPDPYARAELLFGFKIQDLPPMMHHYINYLKGGAYARF